MSRRVISRRDLLLTMAPALAAVLAACGQAPGPVESRPAATQPPAAPVPTPLVARPAGATSSVPASATANTAPAQRSGQTMAKAPAGKTDLVIASAADISKLDPHMSTTSQDIAVSFNLFDTLLARDPDLKLVPRLATEWKATGEKTWEFKLRQDVKFHNGDPLTSADVKFSIERTYDPNA